MKSEDSRRAFLRGAAVAASAAAVTASPVIAGSKKPKRRVVGAPDRPFSRAVIVDHLVYVSGHIGRAPGSAELPEAFEAQCRNVFEGLAAALDAAGSNMQRVHKCTCFLTDQGDFRAMNEMFRQYFPSDPPARSTVVIKELVAPGAKIEIDCVASLA